MSPETAGSYSCQASTPGFSLVSASTSARLRAPPSIMTEPETEVRLGEAAMLWCQSSSADHRRGVLWSHNGREIRPDNSLFSILDTRDGDRLRSVVLIREIQAEHLGQFRCQLSNRFGTNSALLQLREKGERETAMSSFSRI